jgi:hypothetical protein
LSLFKGGIDKMILIDYYLKIMELSIATLPFIGIIITIYFTSNENKEERKFRKKEEEKRFLKEKLEIISEEITEDYLKWYRICNDIRMNISIHEIQKRYSYRKEYKKAFLLVQMYFPSLEIAINSYDFESRLEIYMNYTLKDISLKIKGSGSNEEKIKMLEKEILDQCKEKSEKYNYFMNEMYKVVNEINKMK